MPVLAPRPFSNFELARIEQKLRNDFETGEPTHFEILIDHLRIVPRTADVEQFAKIRENITPGQTREVHVKIFDHAERNHNDTHVLVMEQPVQNQTASLEGIENRLRERWEFDLLKKDHEKLNRDHEKLQTEHEKAREELEGFRSKKLHLGNINLAELGGVFVEGFIRRNPQMLAKLPGGSALAGVIMQDNEEKLLQMQPNPSEAEPLATFSRAEAGGQMISPEEIPFLELLKRIQSSFSQTDFIQVMGLLDSFIADPSLIPLVKDLIEEKPENQNSSEMIEGEVLEYEPDPFQHN